VTSELNGPDLLADRPPIVIAEAPRPLAPWSRYEDQIYGGVPSGFEVRFVGGVTDLAEVDLIHTSGSLDRMMRVGRDSSSKERLVKTKEFVSSLKKHRVRLVRTIHEPPPKLRDQHERQAAEILNDATDRFVRVDPSIDSTADEKTETIPYANMAERFLGYPRREREKGRVVALSFQDNGSVAEGLLKTIGFARYSSPLLVLAGRMPSQLSALLQNHSDRNLIQWRDEVISDAAYIEEITASELVFPPDPKTLYGYHLMMMALTFHRPVAVPASALTTRIAEELGEEWIFTYEKKITPAFIDESLKKSEQSRDKRILSIPGRSISETSERYFSLFREVVRETGCDDQVTK